MGRTIRKSIRTIEPAPPPATTVRPPDEIPVVPGLPVAGNAIPMAGDIRGFLAWSYREYGPIFRIRALGYRHIALVGPEANVFLARISGTHLRSRSPCYIAWACLTTASTSDSAPTTMRLSKAVKAAT